MTRSPDASDADDRFPDVAGGRRASFVIVAMLEDLALLADALQAFMARRIPEEHRQAIELAIVEAVTNVIRHGYPDGEQGVAEVYYSEQDNGVRVEIRDRGRPIPPDKLEQADGSVFAFDPDDIANLPEGGMGLSLIKQLFDTVYYESRDGINRLILEKNC